MIGRGGMADVYRATDQTLLRPVAVKLVRETAEPAEHRRFVDEARTLASLNHPGLITLLDAGILNEQPYLVMELVSGLTLSARIAQEALDPAEVQRIGRQLATALAYAHGQGIVHRDVKPSNVLLCDDSERVLLADFGIARLVGSAQHHTKTGDMIGSPAYLSPEQVAGEEVGPEADVYSLGLVLLEALTGVRAFTGAAFETAIARLHRDPDIPEDLAPAWRSLITRMTRREPDRRPSAAEVAAELADPDWAEGDPGYDHLLGREPEHTPTLSRAGISAVRGTTSRRRLWAGAIAAVALVAVVLLLVASPWSGSPGNDTGSPVPDGVPSRLQQPLAGLHDAIQGHHR
ncbi:MAG TPA: serine/threonine-protein kinase [Marmoricola sp.]|nr:serine/threonine-protein kinase [Marmoricola sp.]